MCTNVTDARSSAIEDAAMKDERGDDVPDNESDEWEVGRESLRALPGAARERERKREREKLDQIYVCVYVCKMSCVSISVARFVHIGHVSLAISWKKFADFDSSKIPEGAPSRARTFPLQFSFSLTLR
jgi:hypothetical protein